MPGSVKRESDEETARGRTIKFVSCYNSPGKKGEGKFRWGSGRETQSSDLGCKEELNKQGRMEESVWHKSKHLSPTQMWLLLCLLNSFILLAPLLKLVLCAEGFSRLFLLPFPPSKRIIY